MRRGQPKFTSTEAFEQWVAQTCAIRYRRRDVASAGNWAALYDAIAHAIDEAARNLPDEEWKPDDLVPVPYWALKLLRTAVLDPSIRHRRRDVAGAGNWVSLDDAIADAIDAAARQRPDEDWRPDDPVPVPYWALDLLTTAVLGPFLSTARTKGKRTKKWVDAYKQDSIDWFRFTQVWYRRTLRDRRDHVSPTDARKRRVRHHLHARARKSKYVVDTSTPYPWTEPGPRDMSVYEAVSSVLAESVYAGTATEVRKSYERVTATIKRGDAWRYYPAKYMQFPGHLRTADEDLTK